MTHNRTCEAALALDENVIETLRTRRSSGESLSKLAAEVGVSWQRLWGVLAHAGQLPPAAARPHPTVQARAGAGPLTERYCPSDLAAIFGKEQVVNVSRGALTGLRAFAAPYPSAFVFEGETGTGKTEGPQWGPPPHWHCSMVPASGSYCDLTPGDSPGR